MSGLMNIGKKISKMISQLLFNHNVGSIDAFTTERGAADCFSPYSEFNCCGYTGDNPAHVEDCRKRLRAMIGTEHIVTARQTHSTNVAVIDCIPQTSPTGVDALVTRLPNVAIGVFTADCVPILLCEQQSGLIAAVHAGWKGSAAGIVADAIETMVNEGADRSGIEAVVGASICQRCFEVGNEVVDEFAKRGFPIDNIVWRNPDTGKAHINLAEANRWLMERAGVPNANISLSGMCTKCEPQRFFSARTLGINSGRILSAIIRRQ